MKMELDVLNDMLINLFHYNNSNFSFSFYTIQQYSRTKKQCFLTLFVYCPLYSIIKLSTVPHVCVPGSCFLMETVKIQLRKTKLHVFFEKLANEKGKEAEKTAQSLPKPRPKHPKGSQRARCGSWPLSNARTSDRDGALGRVGSGPPPWVQKGRRRGGGSESRIYTP